MKNKQYFYVEATFGSSYASVLYGHTESQWIAAQFLKSLKQNRFLIESYPTKEEALNNIKYLAFTGTLDEFHNKVKELFGNVITGEDILGTFETGLGLSVSIDTIPKLSIISTCGDVLGGKFMSFAKRFLLPRDIIGVQHGIGFITLVLGFVRDEMFPPEVVHILVLLFKLVQRHPMFSNEYPFFLDDSYGEEEDEFDSIRYGILKGWYSAI